MTIFAAIWSHALKFVFYYPLFMSYLWMIGAIIFYWKERKAPPYDQPAPLKAILKLLCLFLVLMKGIMQRKRLLML
ncbi:hypothetical protein BANRA_04082 [Acinetobacter baumannii]|nr:hypothetical protein BANRA_04082 [Acinetobacter baumannii]